MIRLLLVFMFLISGCKQEAKELGTNSFYKPQRERIERSISISGKIEPSTKVVITAPLGNKIKALKVRMGQDVRKGEVLLEYDETAVLNEITRLRNTHNGKLTDIKNNEIRLGGIRKKYERAALLFKKKIGAAQDMEEASRELQTSSNQLKVLKADVETDRKILSNAEESLRNLKVTSPISGIVVSLWLGNDTFTPGSSVREGEKLVIVADTRLMIMEGRLAEADSSKVTAKSKVRVVLDSSEGEELSGSIQEVSKTPETDLSTGLATFLIRFVLSGNTQNVRIGMAARADVILETKDNALVVPLYAVKNDGLSEYVEVLEDGVLKKRMVKLGVVGELSAEVLSGISDNDVVKVP